MKLEGIGLLFVALLPIVFLGCRNEKLFVLKEPVLGMEFIKVKKGRFIMGDYENTRLLFFDNDSREWYALKRVEDLQNTKDIVEAGVMSTPGLGIDGEIKIKGRVADVEEIKELLS